MARSNQFPKAEARPDAPPLIPLDTSATKEHTPRVNRSPVGVTRRPIRTPISKGVPPFHPRTVEPKKKLPPVPPTRSGGTISLDTHNFSAQCVHLLVLDVVCYPYKERC
jgi:hypothetical protein